MIITDPLRFLLTLCAVSIVLGLPLGLLVSACGLS